MLARLGSDAAPCRAGSATAYSFSDDPEKLAEYAWYFDNSNETTHQVGKKKPNAFGLFDMHGNVSEWVLDAHTADGYKKFAGKPHKAADAIAWPTKLFPPPLEIGVMAWSATAP